MNPVIVFCYQIVLMKKEPLKDMIVSEIDQFTGEDNIWMGLIKYHVIKTKETNEFLKRYLIDE